MSREDSQLLYNITKEITDTPFVKEIVRLAAEEIKETDLEKVLNELIFKDPIFSMYLGDVIFSTSKKTVAALPNFYSKLKKLPVELIDQLSSEIIRFNIEPKKIFIDYVSIIIERISLASIFSSVVRRKFKRLLKGKGKNENK